MNPADVIKVSLDAVAFIARVAPSLIELWHAHDQKDDVVLAAIDTALILKRAANDRALEQKHAKGVVRAMAARDDEQTSEIGLPGAKR